MIILRTLAFFFLLPVLVCQGQTDKANFPSEIKAVKTAAHINIPGTRLFIISPEGFSLAPDQPVLQKGDHDGIQIMDLAGGNFYTNAATFSRKAFEEKGIKVLDYQEMKVNGYPAKMLYLQTQDGGRSLELVFGDTTFSVLVMSFFSNSDVQAGKDIRKALQTICYDKSFKIDPFARAVFVLDDSHSRLKFSRFTSNMYVYTLDGSTNEDYRGPGLMVSPLPSVGTSPEVQADMYLNKFRLNGTAVLSIDHVIREKVNGLPSFQREVSMNMKGEKVKMFQHVVTVGGTSVTMLGMSTDSTSHLLDFQQLSQTIRAK
jgi:hypothetical protein